MCWWVRRIASTGHGCGCEEHVPVKVLVLIDDIASLYHGGILTLNLATELGFVQAIAATWLFSILVNIPFQAQDATIKRFSRYKIGQATLCICLLVASIAGSNLYTHIIFSFAYCRTFFAESSSLYMFRLISTGRFSIWESCLFPNPRLLLQLALLQAMLESS